MIVDSAQWAGKCACDQSLESPPRRPLRVKRFTLAGRQTPTSARKRTLQRPPVALELTKRALIDQAIKGKPEN